jgi:Na+/H+ antiporter NhaC
MEGFKKILYPIALTDMSPIVAPYVVTMATKREKRDPYLWEALISILELIVFISLAILRYESDAHVPILLGVFVAAVVGLRAGFSWKEIETGMLNGITNSLQAIVILAIIGILIGVWILSGVVPTLLYYGLKILHPTIFLPATLVICSITSLATGSSWGTSGTIGIALIGIGDGLGFPLPLVICAMMFGGIMEKTNQLRVVVTVILKKAQSTGSVITATILTAIGSNLILCDQYMSIVMTGKMYAQSYRDNGLHPKDLSRAIEDSATVTANLVPWNSGGAYQAATLGVPTFAYLPFNFFCLLTPIVSMLYGWINITIDPLEEEVEIPDNATEQGAA